MALMQHSRRQVAQLLGAPPGVVPNYIDPYSRGQQIVITGIVLSSVALIFVTARVLVKLVLTKHFGWDDIFALGALVRHARTNDLGWLGSANIRGR